MRKNCVTIDADTPIHQLKNLAHAASKALARIGIYTYSDLQKTGAFCAWQQLRANGTRWNVVGLYARVGALIDCHWNKLPHALKNRLQQQVKEAK